MQRISVPENGYTITVLMQSVSIAISSLLRKDWLYDFSTSPCKCNRISLFLNDLCIQANLIEQLIISLPFHLDSEIPCHLTHL